MVESIYGTSALDYLARARMRLDESTIESLFYAALELRSGVEARLREYLEYQEHVAKNRRREWNLKKLGRTAEETFKIGDKCARYTFYDRVTGAELGILYYTPVTSSLQCEAEQLGNYLHAAKDDHPSEDPWWVEFRRRLDGIFVELWKATRGQLLGAPLQNKEGKLFMPLEWLEWLGDRPLKGVQLGAQVTFLDEYLETYPEELLKGEEAA